MTGNLYAWRTAYLMIKRNMIQSFKDRETQQLFQGGRIRKFQGFARQATKRLRLLDAADILMALQGLPSNRLEALSGDRQGQ
jgi:proteic killer suppression protein